ncbi:MAG: S1 RNA-binding domain-containing protein [Alphaproteobacteria bacterium]|nr:S1 RNA-binding domain-containing protein [Alphaproteobacteria bacterium]
MPRKKKDTAIAEETVKQVENVETTETTEITETDTVEGEALDNPEMSDESTENSIEVTDYETEPQQETEPEVESDEDEDEDAQAFITTKVTSRREVIQEKRQKESERSAKASKRIADFGFWEQLNTARIGKKILTGVVIGVDTIGEQNVVIVMFNGFRILIPYIELYETPPIDTKTVRSEKDQSNREIQMMRRLLGAEIPFVIKGMSGNPAKDIINNHAIIASRKDAILRIAASNFNIKRSSGTAHIKEGDIVEATIISVGWHGIYVNVCGKDVPIPQFKLTYKYIDNCQNAYKTGDKIRVCIKKVEYDDRGRALSIDVSGKAAEEVEYIPRVQALKEEMTCMGRVTSVQQDYSNPKKVRTWLFLEGWEVPAVVDHIRLDTFMTVNPIQQGDRIVFRIKWIDKDNGFVRGNIISRA